MLKDVMAWQLTSLDDLDRFNKFVAQVNRYVQYVNQDPTNRGVVIEFIKTTRNAITDPATVATRLAGRNVDLSRVAIRIVDYVTDAPEMVFRPFGS